MLFFFGCPLLSCFKLYSTEITAVFQDLPLPMKRFDFFSFININDLRDQAIIFYPVFCFYKVSFFLTELQCHMVFVCVDIQIIYFFSVGRRR